MQYYEFLMLCSVSLNSLVHTNCYADAVKSPFSRFVGVDAVESSRIVSDTPCKRHQNVIGTTCNLAAEAVKVRKRHKAGLRSDG